MAVTMTDRQIALSLAHACTWGDYYNHVSRGNHQNGSLNKVVSSYCMKCTKKLSNGYSYHINKANAFETVTSWYFVLLI